MFRAAVLESAGQAEPGTTHVAISDTAGDQAVVSALRAQNAPLQTENAQISTRRVQIAALETKKTQIDELKTAVISALRAQIAALQTENA